MFNLFRVVKELRERAEKAIKESEEEATVYHRAIAKNNEAHCALMAKLDRRSPSRKMSAA